MRKFNKQKLLIIGVVISALVIGYGAKVVLAAGSIVRVIGDDLHLCLVTGCTLTPTVGNGGDVVIESKLGVGILPSATNALNVGGDSTFNSNRINLNYAGSTPTSGPAIKWTDGGNTNTLGLYVSGGLVYQGDANNAYFKVYTPTTNGTLGTEVIKFGAATTSDVSYINTTGNVGLGTSAPGAQLDVRMGTNAGTYADADAIRMWDGTNGWQVGSNASNFFTLWKVTSASGGTITPYLTMDTSDRLGVGTATPGYKLHAVGDIYASAGWFRVSGTNGLYWETQGTRIWSSDANYVRLGANNGLIFTDSAGTTVKGGLESNGSIFGPTNGAGGYAFYSTNAATTAVFNTVEINGTTSIDGLDSASIVTRAYQNDLVRVPIFTTASASWVVTGTTTNPYVNFATGSGTSQANNFTYWPAVNPGTLRRYQVDVGWSGSGTAAGQDCHVRTILNSNGTTIYSGSTADITLGHPWANNSWQLTNRIVTNGTVDFFGYRVDMYVTGGATCWINNTKFTAEDTVNGADYAENVESYQNLLKGNVVSIDHEHDQNIVFSQRPYQSDVAGVVSTEPGIDIGKVRVGGKPFPLALSGRVPTNVSTINGPIHRGDIITTSSLQGIGMKATKAGPTVGKAYEEFDCQSYANCRDISKVKYWVDDQTVKVDPTTAKGKIYPVTQIVMMLNVSWYDPDVFLTSIDGFNIKFTGPVAQLFNAAGEQIDRVGIFGDAIIAHLKAGVIEVKTLVLDGKDLNDQINNLQSRASTLEDEVKALQSQNQLK